MGTTLQEITFEVSADFEIPEIFQTLTPEETGKAILLGAEVYQTALLQSQKMNMEATYKSLKEEASQAYEEKLKTLQRDIDTHTASIDSLKRKLQEEQTVRLGTEQRVREEERRNREEILREKEARIQSLEQTLRGLEASVRESSKSLTDGFQTFKQQILRTATGSKTKGNSGENILSDLLRKAYGSTDQPFDIQGTGDQGYSGDILMSWMGAKIMWEAKNYTRNVDKKEVDKFLRDMEMNKEFAVGLLISMETGIVGHTKAGDIDMEELQDGRIVIYISNLSRQEDIVYYLQGLRPLLEILIKRQSLTPETTSTDDSETQRVLQERLQILLILIRNHQQTVNRLKNLMNIHKKKHDQMWLELTTEFREAENQVRLCMETLLEQGVTNTTTTTELPEFVFKNQNLVMYSEKERKFIETCQNLFDFREDVVSKSVDIKSALQKEGWSEDSITSLRERVFQEDVWVKGKKDVKYLSLKSSL